MNIKGTPNLFSNSSETAGSSHALYRLSSLRANPVFTSTQAQADQIVTGFFEHAGDWKTFAAITVGGWASYTGRAGLLSVGALQNVPKIAQPLSVLASLGSEVTAFEAANRGLVTVSNHFSGSPHPLPPNLWSFSGQGGWGQGWTSSFVNFSFLRGFGKFAEGQNVIIRHGLQDTGMVFGHQMVYEAGIGPMPEGTLGERFLNAEAMTLQVGASMSLGHGLIPQISVPRPAPFSPERKRGGGMELGEKARGLLSVANPMENMALEGVSMMSSSGPGGSGDGKTGGPTRIFSGASRPSPPPKDPLIGQTIDGRYQVEDMIGSGGMGIVYRCHHTQLRNPVAMKVLQASQLGSPESAERFKREAQAASSVNNPHVIGIKDIGRLENGSIYYVMEYLEGVPLSRLVEGNRPVPLSRSVPIARQVAVGLGAAHAKGVVHRDLKPGNIYLVPSGADKDFVKILDFGIAKVFREDVKDITLIGTVLGTPRYMSPEQARGDPVDHRSDIYSFGVLLYKMATGRVPFDSQNPLSVMEAHMSKPPTPAGQLKPKPQEIPPLLDEIILKSLSKNPSDRYQSMDEVIAALDRLNVEKAAPAPDPAKRPPPKTPPPPKPEDSGEVDTRFIRVPPEAKEVKSVKSVKPEETPPSKKSRWPLLLFLGGAGSVATALVVSGVLDPKRKSDAPPSGPNPSPTPSPKDAGAAPQTDAATSTPTPVSPPALKKVELTIDPPDAQVLRGGKEMLKPFIIEIEPGKTVKLEIRREGYKTKKLALDDSQAQVTIQLEKETKKPPTPIPSNPPPKKDPTEPPPDAPPPEPKYKDFE